ncbi:DNA-packaging protein [Phenylobacterium sp. J367]|uniref:DNA-packaging protein n=1 Tax=Phenylobacterium sp. J367 TaxID=2898435 RepID=UPI0021514DD5|nr:DNA-packaging protein [Phenylobacterium sp. J367]MCR5876944.1 DNA-packaging protein [Phenylobacterium sp. J367]MCR5877011.1 DNA-packaging protein [Phenylobacterium sp. J367]
MAQVGRPTKYDPSYCEGVKEFMGQGYSLTAYAGEIGVARSSINEWMAAHPDFSEAVKVGQAKRTAILERGLLDGDSGPKVTARIFALKNAAPEEWKDKIAHVGGDDADAPIKSELTVKFV